MRQPLYSRNELIGRCGKAQAHWVRAVRRTGKDERSNPLLHSYFVGRTGLLEILRQEKAALLFGKRPFGNHPETTYARR